MWLLLDSGHANQARAVRLLRWAIGRHRSRDWCHLYSAVLVKLVQLTRLLATFRSVSHTVRAAAVEPSFARLDSAGARSVHPHDSRYRGFPFGADDRLTLGCRWGRVDANSCAAATHIPKIRAYSRDRAVCRNRNHTGRGASEPLSSASRAHVRTSQPETVMSCHH